MTALFCFSGSGHSLAVANALGQVLGCDVTEIGQNKETAPIAETAVVVFPVYCQNIPSPVKSFLKALRAKYIALIATYGKISCGNVLYEAQRLVQGDVIAGAYIPTGHTFLDGRCEFDQQFLLPIAQRICSPQKAQIPKTRKNPLSDFFPGLRSRIGVKIIREVSCNSCGLCDTMCPTGAIRKGHIHSGCIRCLRCVTHCPQNALQYKNSWVLEQYLKRYHKEEYRLYL